MYVTYKARFQAVQSLLLIKLDGRSTHSALTVGKGMCKPLVLVCHPRTPLVLREMHSGYFNKWSGLSSAVLSQARFLKKCLQTAFQIMSFNSLTTILFVTGLWYRRYILGQKRPTFNIPDPGS